MIKCNVTLCGTISRDASVRTGKDGKEFVSFPLQVSIPGKNGNEGNMEVSVSKDGGQDTVHEYRYGSRAKVTGTLLLKRRGEKLYFNLSADSVDLSDAGNTDSVKGADGLPWKDRQAHRGTQGQDRQAVPDVLRVQHGEGQ